MVRILSPFEPHQIPFFTIKHLDGRIEVFLFFPISIRHLGHFLLDYPISRIGISDFALNMIE